MYRERPSPATGGVLWSRTVTAGGVAYRVVPDGCLDLIWVDGAWLVAGPDTGPHLATAPAGTTYVGLRFAPGTGPAVLGVPADELRDQRVRLDALWPAAAVRRLAATPDPARALESMAADRVPRADPVAVAVAGLLRAGRSVGASAEAVGLGARQLHRRCRAAFGYGPKTLARILRLDRALALARAGVPYATVAATAGYADQAHLARDVRSLTGVPLGVVCRTGLPVRREEVDAVAVGVVDDGVPHPPEGVPGFLVPFVPGADEPGVDLVDLGRPGTAERQADPRPAARRGPLRIERPDGGHGVPGQPQPAR